MYPNYPHDSEQQHQDTCQRAIEGDVGHVLLQTGSATLTAAPNAVTILQVTFTRPFTPNTEPDVMVCLKSISTPTSTIKNLMATNATDTGFTIQLVSDTAQSVSVTWHAKGKAE